MFLSLFKVYIFSRKENFFSSEFIFKCVIIVTQRYVNCWPTEKNFKSWKFQFLNLIDKQQQVDTTKIKIWPKKKKNENLFNARISKKQQLCKASRDLNY